MRPHLLLVLACSALASTSASGTTFTVNSTADQVDTNSPNGPWDGMCLTASGKCTLRAAIQEANHHAGSTIVLTTVAGMDPTVYTLTIQGRDEDAAVTGDLDITAPVTITGGDPNSIIIDGNQSDRVFDVYAGGATAISGVTIRNGNPGAEAGGGILSGMTSTVLNLRNVIVTANVAAGFGGGIGNINALSLTDVTVSNNTCLGACSGGGIFNMASATLNRVTLNGNSASHGGGVGNDDLGTMTLTNVTISGNTVTANGGGIINAGDATLINVTISNNAAPSGGGGVLNTGTFDTKYTIFSHVPPAEGCVDASMAAGSFISHGHNIADVIANQPDSCALSAASGDLTTVTDPLLAPLGSYGGPTATQALFGGSPALDFGGVDCPPPTCDQRSGHCSIAATTSCCVSGDCPSGQSCMGAVVRPRDGNNDGMATCDAGAFESDGTYPTTTTTSTTTSTTTTLMCGDVNGDDALSIGDALAIAQFAAGQGMCGEGEFTHPELCDVGNPVGCDVGDALRIAQCLVGQVACPTACARSCPTICPSCP